MSVTRAGFRAMIRHALRDESGAVFTDAQLNQWLADALDEYSSYFPRELTATIDAVADQREYSLALYTGIQSVIRVQYPASDDPPRYLAGRSAEDPDGFWGGAFFDVWGGDPPGTLVLAEKPSSGQSLAIRYLADHDFPDEDADTLTVPDRDVNLLATHIRWSALKALETGEASAPSLSSFVLQQIHGSVAGARLEWERALAERRDHGSKGLG